MVQVDLEKRLALSGRGCTVRYSIASLRTGSRFNRYKSRKSQRAREREREREGEGEGEGERERDRDRETERYVICSCFVTTLHYTTAHYTTHTTLHTQQFILGYWVRRRVGNRVGAVIYGTSIS